MRRVVAGSRPALRPASSQAGRRITAMPTCPRLSPPRQFAVTVAARLGDFHPPTHSSQIAEVPLSSRGNRSLLAATCRGPSKRERTALDITRSTPARPIRQDLAYCEHRSKPRLVLRRQRPLDHPAVASQLLARLNSAAGDATGDPAALRRGDSGGSRAPCPSTCSLAGRWRGWRDLHPVTSPKADRRPDERGAGIGCSGLLHNTAADHAAPSVKSRKNKAVRPPASSRVPVLDCSEPLCLPCYTVPLISR
jgi:hypothetical protein